MHVNYTEDLVLNLVANENKKNAVLENVLKVVLLSNSFCKSFLHLG